MSNRYEIDGAVGKLWVTKKDGTEHCVLFDPSDAAILQDQLWHIDAYGYARNRHRKLLSRILMSTPADLVCDHFNRNRLDNRRCNLRNITPTLNRRNSKAKRVYKQGNRWRVEFCVDDTTLYFGWYSNKADAEQRAEAIFELSRQGEDIRPLACVPIPAEKQSGVQGVYWLKARQKWQVTVQGRYLGIYDTVEEAIAVRRNHPKTLLQDSGAPTALNPMP